MTKQDGEKEFLEIMEHVLSQKSHDVRQEQEIVPYKIPDIDSWNIPNSNKVMVGDKEFIKEAKEWYKKTCIQYTFTFQPPLWESIKGELYETSFFVANVHYSLMVTAKSVGLYNRTQGNIITTLPPSKENYETICSAIKSSIEDYINLVKEGILC